jgi:hypothetical protein
MRLKAMQAGAIQAASRARSLWEELGEWPQRPRDNSAVRLSAEPKPDVPPVDESLINSSVASDVAASLSAWEARNEFAVSELSRLHKALRAFGIFEVVDPFIKEHATVHKTDREACQQKLDELLAEVKASEVPALCRLFKLYEESGLGSEAFNKFVSSLDNAECKEFRAQMIEKEIKRAEVYLESIGAIVGPLKELKALVQAAVAFEANVQAGKARFSGNALHFLEEEKFRRRFGRQFPELRDGLIEAIGDWEARKREKFVYHGLELREGLVGLQALPVALVRLPGDLTSMDQVVELLKITDPSPVPAAISARRRRAQSTPSPRKTPKNKASQQSSSATSSPSRPSKPKRARSVGQLIKPPEAPVKASPPRPPRGPEGAAGGKQFACMAAVNISSGLRPPMRGKAY